MSIKKQLIFAAFLSIATCKYIYTQEVAAMEYTLLPHITSDKTDIEQETFRFALTAPIIVEKSIMVTLSPEYSINNYKVDNDKISLHQIMIPTKVIYKTPLHLNIIGNYNLSISSELENSAPNLLLNNNIALLGIYSIGPSKLILGATFNADLESPKIGPIVGCKIKWKQLSFSGIFPKEIELNYLFNNNVSLGIAVEMMNEEFIFNKEDFDTISYNQIIGNYIRWNEI
jgi:hypothetical protein